jgi:thiamine-phosphate pyrophosphorylase
VSPIVYCISEGLADDENFKNAGPRILARLRNAAACGVTHFQLREKNLSAANLFDLALEAALCARQAGVKLLVNGRFDIALAAGADGVHLPADGCPTNAVRRAVPSSFLIGASTHSVEEVVEAKAAGADFVVFGPVFSSPGKDYAVGLDQLAVACETVSPFPVVALGGIDEDRVGEVLGCGATGFAAIRYLNSCIDRRAQAV